MHTGLTRLLALSGPHRYTALFRNPTLRKMVFLPLYIPGYPANLSGSIQFNGFGTYEWRFNPHTSPVGL